MGQTMESEDQQYSQVSQSEEIHLLKDHKEEPHITILQKKGSFVLTGSFIPFLHAYWNKAAQLETCFYLCVTKRHPHIDFPWHEPGSVPLTKDISSSVAPWRQHIQVTTKKISPKLTFVFEPDYNRVTIEVWIAKDWQQLKKRWELEWDVPGYTLQIINPQHKRKKQRS